MGINFYHSAEAANGKMGNPKTKGNEWKISCSNNRTHEESATQAESLHFCNRGSGVYHVLFSPKNWLPLEDGKLKTGLFSDDVERDTDEIRGLEKVLELVGMQSRTEDLNPTEAISPDTAFQLNAAAAHEQIQSEQLDLLKHWSLPFGARPPPPSNDKQKCRAVQSTPSWHPLVMKCGDFT